MYFMPGIPEIPGTIFHYSIMEMFFAEYLRIRESGFLDFLDF
jgi:hypothetical protein